jgi:glycosyltransferase involved in cell wall biosynthesis
MATVSVCMIAYNHEKFIAQAIESILLQKTTHQIEIIIGDDCSTDLTKQIISTYKEKYPELLVVLPSEKNIGMIPNFIRTYESSNGKYVALLEGDDYWTDELKLEKQINFLEQHPDFAICHHKIKFLDENKQTFKTSGVQKEITTIEDLALDNNISTPSCVFRNKLFGEFPSTIYNSAIGDYFLHMLNAQYGKIKFFNEAMSVYRIHNDGIWSNKSNLIRMSNWVKSLDLLIVNFEGKTKENLMKNQAKYLYFIALEYKKGVDDEIFTSLFPQLPQSYFAVFNRIEELEFQLKQTQLKYRIKNLVLKLLPKKSSHKS